MFGYIRPLEAQLRVCELEEYRSVYCGLCRTLGKRFGPAARAALSFDFVFITMMALAIGDEAPAFSRHACPFFPVKKRPHLEICPAAQTACDELVLLLREQFADKISDDGVIRSLPYRAASVLIAPGAKSAGQNLPEVDAICREMTKAQSEAEMDESRTVDKVCDPTATALGKIMSMLSSDENEKRILARLGYMLGRYIYLCDAVDDLEKDRERGAFNPLLPFDDPKEYAEGALKMTIAEAGYAYDLLEPRFFKGVLDNIIYLGLQNTADKLLKGETLNEKSI